MYLEIHITFTAGHFHGREWPPSPARLFQALVAGSHRGAYGLFHVDRRDASLRWLEKQPAPRIFAPDLVQSCDHIVEYVPNNDNKTPVLGHVRAEKSMARYSMPEGTRITYRWSVSEADASNANVIAAMASLVTYLGRTVDSTFAMGAVLDDTAIAPDGDRHCFHPVEEEKNGGWLVPAAGFLDMLNERYPRSASDPSAASPDFTNSRYIDYSSNAPVKALPIACYEVRQLDCPKARAYAPRRARELAGLVRGAMVKWGDGAIQRSPADADRIAQLVHGHQTAAISGRVDGPHFAVVPLPSQTAGFESDGWFRRVAVVGLGCQNEQDHHIFKQLSAALNGAVLLDRGKPISALWPCSEQSSDRLKMFSSKSRIWKSLTPVIIPSYPRRGRKPEEGLMRGLLQAGFQREHIESVATYTGPILPKTESARAYYIDANSYLGRYPRYHAEIIFKECVSGPLLVGAGRYVGLGLFAPADSPL